MRAIVLDNEAVQALTEVGHRKHRQVLAHLSGAVQRRRRGAEVSIHVPTAVRVEEGWDRSDPRSAPINRYRVLDRSLDGAAADVAASIARRLEGVSVADAHIGATVRALPHAQVVVLTSGPGDIERVAGDRVLTAVRL